MKQRLTLFVTLLMIFSMVLAACGGGGASSTAPAEAPAADAEATTEEAAVEEAAPEAAAPSGEAVTIQYWLWDANQLPAYQACADAFQTQNPNISISITQSGWDDYWNTIQTGMVAGTAPDVFTNHLAKYPEFAAKEQLVDIQPFVERDAVDLSVYLGELADLWARDGKRFGLPKDWDTVALAYNETALAAAGVTVDEVNSATWNPDDGGTFGELIAKMTID
ncbi:MAG: ABC transporter substrate-binding protein, partial [Caldilineaceae bacterium]